jgi:hypothetical protein
MTVRRSGDASGLPHDEPGDVLTRRKRAIAIDVFDCDRWTHISSAGLEPNGGTERLNAPDPDEVDICNAWLRAHAKPTKTIRHDHSSYGYKPAVERWAGTYISNGAFIVAALAQGYRAERTDYGTSNADFALRVPRMAWARK